MSMQTSNKIPATIEEAMQLQASILINAFSADKSPIDSSKLDFTKSSLLLVDLILKDFYIEKTPLPDDLHFITSCYVFETFRKSFGGNYLRSDTPNDFILRISEPEEYELICLVMERIWACAQAWEKNSLLAYYDTIEAQIEKRQSAQLGSVPL